MSFLQRQRAGAFLDLPSVVKAAVVSARVDFVVIRLGCGLQGVAGFGPVEGNLSGAVQPGAEGVHRQRLHHIRHAVTGAEELQDAFVDASAGREAEARVQAVAHIGKILVGKQFQQDGRHAGGAAFAVTAVPGFPSGPVRLIGGADVLYHLGLHQVAEKARTQALFPAGKHLGALVLEGIDGKRADDGIVRSNTGIRVESQRQVYGNAPSLRFRIHARTAADFLHPGAPAGVFLGVFFVPFIGNGQVYSAVLQVIEGSFDIGRHPGKGAASFHLAHAASEAYGVGRYYAQAGRVVGELYVALAAFVEEVGAQVNPHTAAHLLVHVLEGFAT